MKTFKGRLNRRSLRLLSLSLLSTTFLTFAGGEAWAGKFTLDVKPDGEGNQLTVRIVPNSHRLESLYPATSGYWHRSKPTAGLPLGLIRFPRNIPTSTEKNDELAACRFIRGVPNVVKIEADYCVLGKDHIRLISSTNGLQSFSAVAAALQGTALDVMSPMPTLEAMDLSDNSIGAGSEMSFLKNVPNLRVAGFAGTLIDDDSVKCFELCPNLEELRLHNTRVSVKGLPILARLRNLKALDISTVVIADRDVDVLARLVNLKLLSVGASSLDEQSIRKMLERGSFESVSFYEAKISSEAKEQILATNPECVFCN